METTENKTEWPKAFTRQQYPVIIAFKEKHYTRYFIADGPFQFGKVFLKILTERFNEKYWYGWMKDYQDSSIKRPKYTKEELDSLPETLQETFHQLRLDLIRYEKALKEEARIKKDYEHIERAVTEEDMYLAYQMLQEMNGGEYEGFEVHIGEDLE